MVAAAGAGADLSQEPGASSRYPMWVQNASPLLLSQMQGAQEQGSRDLNRRPCGIPALHSQCWTLVSLHTHTVLRAFPHCAKCLECLSCHFPSSFPDTLKLFFMSCVFWENCRWFLRMPFGVRCIPPVSTPHLPDHSLPAQGLPGWPLGSALNTAASMTFPKPVKSQLPLPRILQRGGTGAGTEERQHISSSLCLSWKGPGRGHGKTVVNTPEIGQCYQRGFLLMWSPTPSIPSEWAIVSGYQDRSLELQSELLP